MNASELGQTLGGLVIVSIVIAGFIGYVANIVNLLSNASIMGSIELVLSILGLLAGPLGAIMGWIYLI